jgi:hypothetical protein
MTQKKRWKDLAPMQKAGALVMVSVQVSLLASALADIRMRPAAEVRGSKWLWAAISFVNFVGPISYFLFGRKSAPRQIAEA